jgi:hypothetical protein
MKCSNNLKQVGLAVHNYNDTYYMLPAANNAISTNPLSGSYNGGIHFSILPFAEQDNIYNIGTTNATAPNNPPGTQTWEATVPGATPPRLRQQPVKIYQCPSDFTLSNGWAGSQVGNWMGTSYSANYQLFGTTVLGNARMSGYTVATIPDGSSNTIMFTEQYSASYSQSSCGTTATGSASGNLWSYPGVAWSWQWSTVFANTNNFQAQPVTTGNTFFTVCPGNKANQTVLSPPQFKPTLIQADKRLPQTAHTATIQCLLGDGSVRGVASAVTPNTWLRAVLPNDGNVLGSDW